MKTGVVVVNWVGVLHLTLKEILKTRTKESCNVGFGYRFFSILFFAFLFFFFPKLIHMTYSTKYKLSKMEDIQTESLYEAWAPFPAWVPNEKTRFIEFAYYIFFSNSAAVSMPHGDSR